jgi:ATP-dependent RNA circularization protein (DNA/RNA ligase family)
VASEEGQMSTFFRFPHTPHLAWLGAGTPRDDKILSSVERDALLVGEVVVEEKLDGANLGISIASDCALRFQNRGQYLDRPYRGQFQRLAAWIAPRQQALRDVLTPALVVFGEWCAARHSVRYDRLPDWFVVFDVYDRVEERFFSTTRRDALAARLGLITVSKVFSGRTTLAALKERLLTESSRYHSGPIEGLVIRKQSKEWLASRAKLVHPDFVQNIGEHWQRRRIEWNRLGHSNAGEPTAE